MTCAKLATPSIVNDRHLLDLLDIDFGVLLKGVNGVAGPSIAELLHRACIQLKRGEWREALSSGDMCRDACWEQLHTGDWKQVDVAWRDCYTAASLVCIASETAVSGCVVTQPLKAASPPSCSCQPCQLQQGNPSLLSHSHAASIHYPSAFSPTENVQHEFDKLLCPVAPAQQVSALRQLDMAVLMGGPRFRPLVDAVVARLQDEAIAAALKALRQRQVAAAAVCVKACRGLHLKDLGQAVKKRRLLLPPCRVSAESMEGPPIRTSSLDQVSSCKNVRQHHKVLPAAAATECRTWSTSKPLLVAEAVVQSCTKATVLSIPPVAAVIATADITSLKLEKATPAFALTDVHAPAAGAELHSRDTKVQSDSTEKATSVNTTQAATHGGVSGIPLPPHSLYQGSLIRRQPLPSIECFLTDFVGASEGRGIPAVITGGIDHWPALERWHDATYLKDAFGARTVPVEVGPHYLAPGWGQRLMTLSEFIDSHLGEPTSPGCDDTGEYSTAVPAQSHSLSSPPHSTSSQTQTSSPAAHDASNHPRGYLAQHELFDQIPALKRDIVVPDFCCLGRSSQAVAINAWFGPPGTVTPPHTDPHQNLLAQVVGRKYVRLWPPSATAKLYPFQSGFTTNASQVNIEDPDLERFPMYKGLHHLDCLLSPGDMLFIPRGWWHFVKALQPSATMAAEQRTSIKQLSASFSVSFWFD